MHHNPVHISSRHSTTMYVAYTHKLHLITSRKNLRMTSFGRNVFSEGTFSITVIIVIFYIQVYRIKVFVQHNLKYVSAFFTG